jgi:hypothetical protein
VNISFKMNINAYNNFLMISQLTWN